MSGRHDIPEDYERLAGWCRYCHGARLVGWSGAGPILCPECSRGADAFTVVTQAWREQRARVRALEAENERLRDDLAAERRLAAAREHPDVGLDATAPQRREDRGGER